MPAPDPRSQGRTCEGLQLWSESRREQGTNMPAAQPILTVVGETALVLGKPKALHSAVPSEQGSQMGMIAHTPALGKWRQEGQ